MRNFVIFFHEKEGTTALVTLLNNFKNISIVHQVNNQGWEPFNKHNCGSMTIRDFDYCLDMVLNDKPVDFEKLNQIYTKTAVRPLDNFSKNGVVGLKMRFSSPQGYNKHKGYINRILSKNIFLDRLLNPSSFKSVMFDLLKRNDVVVFLAIRQNLLRWGLSKYHGSGSNKGGHLQFKLASGKITKDQMKKMIVDCTRLEKIVKHCEKLHFQKRRLMQELRQCGIQAYPLLYEDFLEDKKQYFSEMLKLIKVETAIEEIDDVLDKGTFLKKVHSDDISDFVENHEEVQEKFSNRFIAWR